jgi:hypothetical protein
MKRYEQLYMKSKQQKTVVTTAEKELKSCTFQPQILAKERPTKSPNKEPTRSPEVKPRGYEKTVERLRMASIERDLLEPDKEPPLREYKRYTGVKPFQFANSQKLKNKEHSIHPPLFYLDINLEDRCHLSSVPSNRFKSGTVSYSRRSESSESSSGLCRCQSTGPSTNSVFRKSNKFANPSFYRAFKNGFFLETLCKVQIQNLQETRCVCRLPVFWFGFSLNNKQAFLETMLQDIGRYEMMGEHQLREIVKERHSLR